MIRRNSKSLSRYRIMRQGNYQTLPALGPSCRGVRRVDGPALGLHRIRNGWRVPAPVPHRRPVEPNFAGATQAQAETQVMSGSSAPLPRRRPPLHRAPDDRKRCVRGQLPGIHLCRKPLNNYLQYMPLQVLVSNFGENIGTELEKRKYRRRRWRRGPLVGRGIFRSFPRWLPA